MKFLKRSFSVSLLMATMSVVVLAQNPKQVSPDVEVERMRLEAQERARQDAEQRDWVTKIFEIKYAQPYAMRQALSMFRATFNPDPNSRILAVRAPKDIMPAIEDAIKRLDIPTPKRDAELTAYVVMASDQADSGNLPAVLQPVVAEMRKILAYRGYQLVDTLLARGGENRDVNLQGVLPLVSGAQGGSSTYQLSGRLNVDNDGKVPVLRITNLKFSLLMSGGPAAPFGGGNQVTINTDVEIPQGQQIVVGKGTFMDRAFILVMSAKFTN